MTLFAHCTVDREVSLGLGRSRRALRPATAAGGREEPLMNWPAWPGRSESVRRRARQAHLLTRDRGYGVGWGGADSHTPAPEPKRKGRVKAWPPLWGNPGHAPNLPGTTPGNCGLWARQVQVGARRLECGVGRTQPWRPGGNWAEDVGAPPPRAEGLLPASLTPLLTPPNPTADGLGLFVCLFWSINLGSWGAWGWGLTALPRPHQCTMS